MDTHLLISNAEQCVRKLFSQGAATSENALIYHNIEHTEKVAFYAAEIAEHYQLADEDKTALMIAAWFHDTGYLTAPHSVHEEKSIENAIVFLKGQNVDDAAFINKMKGCIEATKMPQRPTNLMEEILCDADLYNLGTDYFKESNRLMHKEAEINKRIEIPSDLWLAHGLQLLHDHKYHTDYCRQKLEEGKQKNIKSLLKKQKEKTQKQLKADKTPKIEKPKRGIETMFRTTANNHIRLSGMADQKAHIMITVNSIIISILVSSLFRKLQDDSRLLIPALMLMSTCLVSIVFAILATRPNITSGVFTKDDIKNKSANLLFFGNFYKMTIEDYTWGMSEMRNDAAFLYNSMTRDIYHLGVVLGKKYKLLRVGYSIFMFGFIISAIAFVVAITVF